MELVFFGALTSVGALFDFKERKMSNYGHRTEPNAEKNISADVSKENIELFKRALSEGLSAKIDKTLEEYKDVEIPIPT